MAADAGPLAARGGWLVLAVTLAAQAMVSMASMTMPAAAPVVAAFAGFPVERIGIYMAAMFSASVVATLGAGTLVSRYGAMRVSQAGLLLCAAGLSLCAWPSPVALAAGMVLVGLGYGPMTPASSHLLAATTPRHRLGFVFSVKQTGVPLGGMLAGMLVPSLLLWFGLQAALLAIGAACLACAVMAIPLRAQLDADRSAVAPLRLGNLARPLQLVFADRVVLRLACMSTLLVGVQLCLTTYLVAYLHQRLGYSLVAAGMVLAAAQAGGALGRIAWGQLADMWHAPRRVLALVSLLVAAGSMALASMQQGLPVVALGALLAVFGACAIGWNGVYLAEVARLAPPGLASTATSGALVFTYAGMVGGPALFAAVLRVGDSYALAFGLLAVPALACVALMIAPQRRSG